MKLKTFGYVSLIALILTIIWLVLLIVSMAGKGNIDTLEAAISSVIKPDIFGYASYVNVVILTLIITALFTGIYLYCKKADHILSLIGLIFMPVYCILNVFSYLSQITLVPALVDIYGKAQYQDIAYILLGQSIQFWNGSMVSVLNNLAYAILGLSCIAFGIVLFKMGRYAKIAGALLILNAIACIVGVIGIVTGNELLGLGSLIGGVIFIFALIPLTLMFLKEVKE